MTDFVPGGIANAAGDLFGTSPFRIIRTGKIVIDVDRAREAMLHGWNPLDKVQPSMGDPCDDDFAWLERSPEEREEFANRLEDIERAFGVA